LLYPPPPPTTTSSSSSSSSKHADPSTTNIKTTKTIVCPKKHTHTPLTTMSRKSSDPPPDPSPGRTKPLSIPHNNNVTISPATKPSTHRPVTSSKVKENVTVTVRLRPLNFFIKKKVEETNDDDYRKKQTWIQESED
ncbi:hypothetical protein M8C21_024593, partial [Ambrosia artemisiifolia]